jgi:hypothetical protein
MSTTQLEFPTQSAAELPGARQAYLRFRYALAADPRYHFSIVLPRGWRVDTAAPVAPSPDDPVQVPATFVVARGLRTRAEILLFHLARDVAPADWLDILLDQRGEQVLARREAASPGGLCADVLTRFTAGRGGFVSRWTALKTGPTLFVVHCSAPAAEYPQRAVDFATAVTELRLLHPSSWLFAEPMHRLTLPIPSDLAILLPKSWSLRRDDGANTRAVSFSATNFVGDERVGWITLAGVARSGESSAESLVANYLCELRRNRVGIHRVPLAAAEACAPFDGVWRGSAEGLRFGEHVDVRVFVGRCEGGWLLVAGFGPARSANARVWAINRRAFDIAADHVQCSATTAAANEPCLHS